MKKEGDRAEALAAKYLLERGLRIIETNYRCRQGEIDLICREGKTLVFVEVRLRRNGAFGGAAESITATKRWRLIQAARHYLGSLGETPPCRFDVILLKELHTTGVEWIQDAFTE